MAEDPEVMQVKFLCSRVRQRSCQWRRLNVAVTGQTAFWSRRLTSPVPVPFGQTSRF